MDKKQNQKLTPEAIEIKHQQEFLQAYQKLVEEYGYILQPVLKLQLTKLPTRQKNENVNPGNK